MLSVMKRIAKQRGKVIIPIKQGMDDHASRTTIKGK